MKEKIGKKNCAKSENYCNGFSLYLFSGPSWLELRQQTSSMHLREHHQHHKIESRSISSSTWAEIEKQPYFLPTTTTMTVQEGGHAFFICKVENLYNQTVSYYHLLFL